MGVDLTIDLDDPEATLGFVTRPLAAVRDAFFDGVSYADTQLSKQPFDSHYWSHSVRYRARVVLANEAANGAIGWGLGRQLPNSGIELVVGPVVIRILKAQDDGPPHPGYSRARKAFWTQRGHDGPFQLTLALAFDGVSAINGSNLLLDWTVDKQKEVMLALSKPVGVWNYQTKPKIAWRRHVVFGGEGEPQFIPPEEDVDVEDVSFEIEGLSEPGSDG